MTCVMKDPTSSGNSKAKMLKVEQYWRSDSTIADLRSLLEHHPGGEEPTPITFQ